MEFLSVTILICTAIFIVLYVFAQAIRGTVDLFSTRNLFLAGLIIFQVTGPMNSILLRLPGSFQPADLGRSSMIYTVMLLAFLVLFLITYRRSTRMIDKLMSMRGNSSFKFADTSLIIIAITTIPLGILCQYVLVMMPVLGPGFRVLSYGLYSVAVGLATWVWARRLFNPIVMLMACSIILVAVGLTLQQNFGRRPLLGIVMVIGWSAYFSHWKYLGLATVLKRGFIVGGAGFVLLALVTSAREVGFGKQSAIENLSSLKDASFSSGAIDMLTGQNAGLYSMWLIESRPESHPYDTLHTVRLVLFFPIPRAYWPGKPDALGLTMPSKELKIPGKPPGWNIGPGLIGHIANDNPWLALWMYPIFFGLFFRVLDRVVIWFSDNPFAVLPMGAALGQIIAIPRGEVGTFLFNALVNIFGALMIMLVISTALKLFGIIQPIGAPQDEDGIDYDDEYQSLGTDPYLEYTDAQESY